MTDSSRSVRRQLLVQLLIAVSVAWLLAAVISYRDARHEVAEVLDAHLAQTASLISVQRPARADERERRERDERGERDERDNRNDEDEIDTAHAPVLHRYGRRVMFQVWHGGTTLGLHSLNAPNTPLSTMLDGFSDAVIDGNRWRVFSTWDPDHRTLIQVAEQNTERSELSSAVARNFLVPLVLTLPVLGLAIWMAVGRATHSLTDINRQVAGRTPDNLAPIDVGGAPTEIRALITNLNGLLARVQDLLERERRFTADAAHELRTPIAAIRAQAQVARGADAAGERAHALDSVIAGCDRAGHTVDQMLTLARLAPDAVLFTPQQLVLDEVVRSTLADLVPFAMSHQIDVEFAGTPAVVRGDAGLLGILCRNLVDNAIRYSPSGSRVLVDVEMIEGAARLRVTDAGPGLSETARQNIGRRFYRAPGSTAPGSGLGLSIVQRIAELHGATIEFGDPPEGHGLRATLTLPN